MHRWQKEAWIEKSKKPATQILWRAVEAQHLNATMRLVDTLAEQFLLEQLLETSKPPLPPSAMGQHFLLSTPFRYTSPQPSRFRAAHHPGVWYGAFDRQTACTEVGYWRWRFFMDSTSLSQGELQTEHSLFQAKVQGLCIDLAHSPWLLMSPQWQDPNNYTHCQALAQECRAQNIEWISYTSSRQPQGQCAAVLVSHALTMHKAQMVETWHCRITRSSVIFRHFKEGFSFDPNQR